MVNLTWNFFELFEIPIYQYICYYIVSNNNHAYITFKIDTVYKLYDKIKCVRRLYITQNNTLRIPGEKPYETQKLIQYGNPQDKLFRIKNQPKKRS